MGSTLPGLAHSKGNSDGRARVLEAALALLRQKASAIDLSSLMAHCIMTVQANANANGSAKTVLGIMSDT